MKKFKYILSAAIMVVALASCLKDEGNYVYTPLPKFIVDTVGVATSFEVRQSVDNLQINPKVVYDGNESELTYVWQVGTDTLARVKNINRTLSLAPGSYTLDLQVKNSKGISAFMRYPLTVFAAVPPGWTVLYENAAGKSDVSLIRTREMFTALAQDYVANGVVSSTNSGGIDGAPVAIHYMAAASTLILTKTGGAMLRNTDYLIAQTYANLFAGNTPPANPEAIYPGTFSRGVLMANKEVWFGYDNVFPTKVIITGSNYEAAPFYYPQASKQGGFYDSKNQRFVVIEQNTSVASLYANANASARFNLNNIGKKLLFLDRGFLSNASPADSYKYAFFRDNDDSHTYLYVMNVQTPLTPDIAKIDITDLPEIAQSKFYALGNLGPAVFYATDSKIYNFTFNQITNTYGAATVGLQLPSSEKITCMKLHKNQVPSTTTLPNDSRFLLVGTWNEATKEGKFYQIEVNVTNGTLNTSTMKSWGGMGKIVDIKYKTT